MKKKKRKKHKDIEFPSLDALFREYEARRSTKNKRPNPYGLKSKCCRKYMKGEDKRCRRCPCFDLSVSKKKLDFSF